MKLYALGFLTGAVSVPWAHATVVTLLRELAGYGTLA